MTIWLMRIACCIPEATNTHSGCVLPIAFLLQRWLDERVSLLRYAFITCLVTVLEFTLLVGCWVAVCGLLYTFESSRENLGCLIALRILELFWETLTWNERKRISHKSELILYIALVFLQSYKQIFENWISRHVSRVCNVL